MDWYYALEGTQHGPVSQEELQRLVREGTVASSDFIWTPSMGESWKTLAETPELMQGAPIPQAPLPPNVFQPAPQTEAFIDAPPPFTGQVSCTDPIAGAWDRMRDILFRPFDLGKWLALGFTAWLATLTQQGGSGGGGGGGNFTNGFQGTGTSSNTSPAEDISAGLREAWAFVQPFMAIIIPVVILLVALGLFFLWLQCRGKFMFLDNVVNDRAEIKLPWARFSQHARSLFFWNLGFSIVCMIVFGAWLAGALFAVLIPLMQTETFSPALLMPTIALSVVVVILSIVYGYIIRFIEDFIIPLMYKFDLTTHEAWGRFRQLSHGHVGNLLLYGILYWLMASAWGLVALIVGLLACGIGCCLMALPFLGAVYLLPMTVHLRCYSLGYLAQFAPDLRMTLDEHQSVLP